MKKPALMFAVATLVAVNGYAQESPQQMAEPQASSVKVGTGVDLNPFSAIDAYIVVELDDQHWKIVGISESKPDRIDPAKQELLAVGRSFTYVEPYFRDYYQYEKTQGTDPKKPAPYDPYVCFSGQKDERPRYNPCDSKLTHASDVAKTLFGNAVMTVFSLGIANARMGVGSAVSIDREKVLAVVNETNAIEAARQHVRQARYRNAFERAKTVEENRAFIQSYKENDPDGLIARAEARIPEIEKAEQARRLAQYRSQFEAAKTSTDLRVFIQRYESDDPDRLIPKARQALKSAESHERQQAAAAEERARKMAAAEVEQRKREASVLSLWRTRLKVGDDTFCGPVIELRQPMVKIAVSAQLPGYPSEAWLKTSEVLPADAGCRNINGRLLPAYR